METTTGLNAPDSISINEVPFDIQERLEPEPWSPIPDGTQLASPRLRFLGRTQTEVARQVRPRERRAVIIGVEGVLVDTREPDTLSWLVALHDCGHNVALDLLRELSGMSASEVLRIAAGVRADSAAGREMIEHQQQIFRTWYLPRILPFVGGRRLIQRMKGDGLRLIAMSSGSASLVPELMRASGVAPLIDDVVAADGEPLDAVLGEIITSTISRCGGTRDGIVLLGDSPYDVVVGERSGIDVVALRCSGWADASLQGAVAVYRDHVHLLEQYPRSPFSAPRSSKIASLQPALMRVP
jgi:phosphoglycolate phosphatase-like HAD superfamily hydrolase